MKTYLSPAANSNYSALFAIILISLAIFYFFPVLFVNYFCDDYSIIKYNPHLENPASLFQIFTNQAITTGDASCFDNQIYRPFRTLYYIFVVFFFGKNPIIFHFLNLIWHIGTVAGLYLLFIKECPSLFNRCLSIFLCLTFLFHPLHLENINTLNAVGDILGSLLCLACMLILSHSDKFSEKQVTLLFILCYSAMLFKEIFITLPIILILYFFSKLSRTQILILFSSSLLYFLQRCCIVKALAQKTDTLNFFQHILYIFQTITAYLINYIFPVNLSQAYLPASFPYLNFFIPALLLILFFFYYLTQKRSCGRTYLLYLLAFLISMIPISNLIPIRTFINDRLFYFPSLILFISLYSLSVKLKIEVKKNFYSLTLCFLLFAYTFFLFFSGYKRNLEWLDQGTLLHKSWIKTQEPVLLWNMVYTLYQEQQYERLLRFIEKNPPVLSENEIPRYYKILCMAAIKSQKNDLARFYYSQLQSIAESDTKNIISEPEWKTFSQKISQYKIWN